MGFIRAFSLLLSNSFLVIAFMVSHTNHITHSKRNLIEMAAVATEDITVQSLLKNSGVQLKELAAISPESSELTLLRFALGFSDRKEARRALRETVAYRKGGAKSIFNSAAEAISKATEGGGWENDIVRDAAPHAATINKYITSKNILTLSTEEGDLVYVIRASLINDKELMSKVSVKQMTEFFLYVKEVHNLVANERSKKTDRFCKVIFANDISGVLAIPDRRFQKALTESSQQYEKLYPSLAGPTMILNLPRVLQTFIGLIKPLFPKTVQDRLTFARAPVLKGLKDLTPLTNDETTRKSFLAEIGKLST